MASSERELEALFVRIWADAKPFLDAAAAVDKATVDVITVFNQLGRVADNLTKKIEFDFAAITSTVVTAANTITRALTGMGSLESSIDKIGTKIGTLAQNLTVSNAAFNDLPKTSENFGRSMESLRAAMSTETLTTFKEMVLAFQGVATSSTNFRESMAITGGMIRSAARGVVILGDALTPEKFNITRLERLGRALFSISGFASNLILPDRLATSIVTMGQSLASFVIPTGLVDAFDSIARMTVPAGLVKDVTALGSSIAPLAAAMDALSKSLVAVSNTPMTGVLSKFKTALDGLILISPGIDRLSISLLDLSQVLQSFGTANAGADALAKLARGLTALTKFSANITTISNAFRVLAISLNDFNTRSSIAIQQFIKLGAAAGSMASLVRVLNAGGSPTALNLPVLAGTVNNFTNVTRAAVAGSSAIGNFSTRISDLGRAALTTYQSLSMLRLGVAGFAVAGMSMLAKLDDAVAHTMARMGTTQFRSLIEGTSQDIASRSITSADHLATAFGALTASGMNAALAVHGLAVAENFAVASGMEMVHATNRLVTLQRNLGMSSMDVTRHLANMNQISDVLVRAWQLGGDSVEHMTDMMTPRFAAAVRQMGVGLEEGTALLLAFNQAGLSGTRGGDMAARFIHMTERLSIEHAHVWERLGISIQGVGQASLPLSEIVSRLENRFAGLNRVQREAVFMALGIQDRFIATIEPVLGYSGAIREWEQALRGASGTMEAVNEILRSSFKAQIMIAWNNIKNLATEVGRVLAPAIAYLASGIRVLSEWFRGLNPEFQRFVVWATVLGSSLAIITPILGVLGTISGAALSVIGMFGTILTAVLTFKALFIGALVAISVALGGPIFVGAFLGISERLGGVQNVLGIIYNIIVRFGGPVGLIVRLFADFEGTVADIRDSLEGMGGAFNRVLGFFVNIRENLTILREWFSNENRGNFVNLGNIMATVFFNLMHNIRGVFRIIGEFIDWFVSQFPNMLHDAGSLVSAAFAGIGRAFGVLIDFISRLWESFWTSAAGDAVKRGLSAIGPAIREWFVNLGRADAMEAANRQLRATLGPVIAPADLHTLSPAGLAELHAAIGRAFRAASDIAGPDQGAIASFRVAAATMSLQVEALQGNRRLTNELGAALQQATRVDRPEFRTQPFRPGALQLNSLLQVTPQQAAARAAALLGMAASPLGIGGFQALALSSQPFLDLPQLNTGVPGIHRPLDRGPTGPAVAALLGNASIMGGLGVAPLINQFVAQSLLPGFLHQRVPQVPEGGPQSMLPLGAGHGPGFQFMQTAESRFMLGGETTRQIEQQVHDSQSDRHLQNIQRTLEVIADHTDPANLPRPRGTPAPFVRGHPSDLP